jgi:hypothetical protein
MKAQKKATKPKVSGETDCCRVPSDGLWILARIIARSYTKHSSPNETNSILTSDGPSHNQPTVEDEDGIPE